MPEGSAELFVSRRLGSRASAVTYRRFETCSEAVRHAVEVVDLAKFPGTVIEVDELRLDSKQITDLYASMQ